MTSLQILVFLIALVGGAFGASKIQSKSNKPAESIQRKIRTLLEESQQEAKAIRHEAKGQLNDFVEAEKQETSRLKAHVERLEESLKMKEKHVQERVAKNDEIKNKFKEQEEEIKAVKAKIAELRHEEIEVLLKKLKKTQEEAFEEASQQMIQEINQRKEKFIKQRMEEAQEDGSKKARDILVGAIQKYSDTSSVDRNENMVEVKQERFKAILVGKNAQAIQYFEEKAGLDIIFNDAPKTITISGANLPKRQMAKSAIEYLQRLNRDLSPGLIDEALAKGEQKIKDIMTTKAREAVKKIGLKEVPEGVLAHIGRLHFRTSYGQNALKHCLEVGIFSGLIAAEIGANIEVARFAGFFHDIGKALSEESDKGHDFITKDILEEFNYPEEIIHAAWVHHEAEPAKTLEAKIVMAADALSASRPGARLESLDRYLERIRDLEQTAGSFPGVKKTFAISAGREVRVLVNPDKITDEHLNELAHQIAEKIERELTYPGNVKVNVIRRMRWSAKVQSK